MGEIGIKELLLIGIVILLLFGTKKLPDLMRGLGKGLKTFNDGKNSIMDEIDNIKNPVSSTISKTVKTTKPNAISDLEHEPVKKS